MNAIINFVNAIPDSIGWALVGCLFTLCVVMGVKLAKMFIQMWKDYHEDEEEE